MGIVVPFAPIPKASFNAGKHPERLTLKQYRDYIWTRDYGRSRATGHLLYRGHASMTLRGEVCHLQSKGAHPDRAFDVNNAVLMSGHEHWLSDSRGGHLLRLYDPITGDPATDASRPILFVLKTRGGEIVWEQTR